MDKQTKLKQATTVVQVLREASKFNNLPYPQWFLSLSLLGSFFTMPLQPQPDQVIELTEVKEKKKQEQSHPKRPSMVKTPSSKPSTSVATLAKKFEEQTQL
ncbi:hypothetical protein TrLO_g6950 [Triparma laevis f. longispina]|uniref:Uncharacterized protein n=1 Tax=Triparma laevis f. longispina TaxID=1714387 RepID=A0A9W7AK47_9STRA|nr:hypothetical protein TrLO_g6950 [Triparma laevis f. longispina]